MRRVEWMGSRRAAGKDTPAACAPCAGSREQRNCLAGPEGRNVYSAQQSQFSPAPWERDGTFRPYRADAGFGFGGYKHFAPDGAGRRAE